jgi:hypothetical protein
LTALRSFWGCAFVVALTLDAFIFLLLANVLVLRVVVIQTMAICLANTLVVEAEFRVAVGIFRALDAFSFRYVA